MNMNMNMNKEVRKNILSDKKGLYCKGFYKGEPCLKRLFDANRKGELAGKIKCSKCGEMNER